MFSDTITIYNRCKVNGKEAWRRHVIQGANWTENQGMTARKTGVMPTNGVTIVIPGAALVGYIQPKAWASLEDPGSSWTVAPQDTVVLGECGVEISTTPARDLSALDGVRTVTMVDSYSHGAMAHLEVTGK